MGLLNVISLANDYNKAKKLLKKSNAKMDELRKVATSIIKGVEYLKDIRARISKAITKYSKVASELLSKLGGKKK